LKHRKHLQALAAVASAALLIPAAAVAVPGKGNGRGQGSGGGQGSGNGHGADKGGQGSSNSGRSSYHHNVDGTVARIGAVESADPTVVPDPTAADDVLVDVTGGNSRGRELGTSVTFDLSGARIKVADTNGDGVQNLGDVKVGDTVKVKLRLPRDGSASQPFAAEEFEVKAEGEVVTP
jgi:hypothetical protein